MIINPILLKDFLFIETKNTPYPGKEVAEQKITFQEVYNYSNYMEIEDNEIVIKRSNITGLIVSSQITFQTQNNNVLTGMLRLCNNDERVYWIDGFSNNKIYNRFHCDIVSKYIQVKEGDRISFKFDANNYVAIPNFIALIIPVY